MDTKQFEEQYDEIKSYDGMSYGSAAAKHVKTALTMIDGLIGRINELEQAKDHYETAAMADESETEVCRVDQSNEALGQEVVTGLDNIIGVINGLTSGSIGSTKRRVRLEVDNIKMLFN